MAVITLINHAGSCISILQKEVILWKVCKLWMVGHFEGARNHHPHLVEIMLFQMK